MIAHLSIPLLFVILRHVFKKYLFFEGLYDCLIFDSYQFLSFNVYLLIALWKTSYS